MGDYRGSAGSHRAKAGGGLVLVLGLGVFLAAPLEAQQTQVSPALASVYVQLMGAHFAVPVGEASLLVEDMDRIEELPAVLVLARESGLAPAVILSRRQRGGPGQPTPWVQVARQVNLGSGVFHVDISDDEVTDRVRRATELFAGTPPGQWDRLELNDDEVSDLVHVKVLSRYLTVSKRRVLEAREEAGSWVQSIPLLMGVP